jgi:hypothetical protein
LSTTTKPGTDFCNHCRVRLALIFQDNGNYSPEYWQEITYLDI